MILITQPGSDGKLTGKERKPEFSVTFDVSRKRETTPVGSGFADTLTNRVMSGPVGSAKNGSLDVSLTISRAGTIMISHFERQFRNHRCPENPFAHVFPDHEGSHCAHV